MLRPVRLVIVCLIAFTAGVLFERRSHSDACAAAGGTMSGPFCEGATHD